VLSGKHETACMVQISAQGVRALSKCTTLETIELGRDPDINPGVGETSFDSKVRIQKKTSGPLEDSLSAAAILTSGPFGDSMSAAARPRRWGVSRQAKGREFNPTRSNLSPYLLDGACFLRVPGEKKEKEMISMNGLRLMDQNWSQLLTLKDPYPT
jgi:hypothetical protein